MEDNGSDNTVCNGSDNTIGNQGDIVKRYFFCVVTLLPQALPNLLFTFQDPLAHG